MKAIQLLSSALTAVLCLSCQGTDLQKGEKLKLSDGWKLSSGETPQAFEASVPSTVAGVLADNGVFGDDLYFSDNYLKVDRTPFDGVWTYSRSFALNKAEDSHYFLKFEGLDFYADIDLNGSRIAASDTTYGVFIIREYDVTDLLAGSNDLKVSLRRALPGDLNIGFVDWSPRPLDESMGITRDVTLRCTGDVKMDDFFVYPHLDTDSFETAVLELRTVLTNLSADARKVEIKGAFDGIEFTYPLSLEPFENRELVLTDADVPELLVKNPRVWWCRGMKESGELAQMYEMSVECVCDGKTSDSDRVSFGIRSIESYLDGNNYRVFVLNGREVMPRGAGWADELLLRDTHESLEKQIQKVAHMNLNCVRFENIWGKDQTIYDLCDKYGILALVGWSCQWEWEDYCGLPETDFGCIASEKDMTLAANYLESQIKWLRNHPSVFGWMVGSDRTPNPELERRYLEIFDRLEYRPYIGSAKGLVSEVTGPTGTKMTGPYDYVGPEYWYLDTTEGGAFGFNTETGIGINLPVEESIREMVPTDSLWPLSSSWDRHCTASTSAMNTMKSIAEPVNASFGGAADLKDFIRKAQALDYDATRAMYEAFRTNIPLSTGIVHWMLNSAWPSMFWQLYDFYQVPTAAYYAARKANEPVHASYNYKDRSVYVLNETGYPVNCSVQVKVFNAASELLSSDELSVMSENRKPQAVLTVPQAGKQDIFLHISIARSDDGSVSDNFYCIPAKANNYLWDRPEWYVTPIDPYSDMLFVSALPAVDVEFSYEFTSTGVTATLVNASSVISYQNVLKLVDAGGEIIEPSFWDDNYFPVLPGETKTVVCKVPDASVLKDAKVVRSGWNE